MLKNPLDDPDSTEDEREAWRDRQQCPECKTARGSTHRDGCSGQFREEAFGVPPKDLAGG